MSMYQLMPPLSAAEYEQLRQDIQENGVLVAVIEDEEGNVLDGHNRSAICDELGIECPTEVVAGYSDAEKRKLVYNLNLHRRHLSKEQRNEVMRKMRSEGATLQQIADATGTSVKTAHRATDSTLSNDKVEGKRWEVSSRSVQAENSSTNIATGTSTETTTSISTTETAAVKHSPVHRQAFCGAGCRDAHWPDQTAFIND